MSYNFAPFKQSLTSSEEWLKKEFAQLRTGRATPSILDGVLVESYGTRVPVNQVAGITVEDARSLRVVPWDMSQVKNIEKAITASNLGLSLAIDDKGLRAIFPELTSERRESLKRVAKAKLEEAKVAVRKERDKVWGDIQAKEKAKEIAEDDKFRLKNEMQKIVDDANKRLEEQYLRKEKEMEG